MPLRLSKTNSLYASFRAEGVDSSAQDFIEATGITNQTQKNAINKLTLDLKVYGIWPKIIALYPIIGGTATTHKFNLKNPADTNGAYRLSFQGGWTHSATGITPNGSTGYANTFLSTSAIGLNSGHMAFYSRTNLVSSGLVIEMGALKSTPDSYSDLQLGSTNQVSFRFNNQVPYDPLATTNTQGFYIGSRTASNIIRTFKNGNLIINGTSTSNATTTTTIYIGAVNNGNTGLPIYWSTKECALASIGTGLTDVEAFNFNSIVQNYQTLLGRQV
jgi:hypothetical protein